LAEPSVNSIWMLNNGLRRGERGSLDLPADPEALLQYRSLLSAELSLVESRLQALGGFVGADRPGPRRADR
jgi:hypothetical protein